MFYYEKKIVYMFTEEIYILCIHSCKASACLYTRMCLHIQQPYFLEAILTAAFVRYLSNLSLHFQC